MFEELLRKARALIDEGRSIEAVDILLRLKYEADADFLEKNDASITELFGAAYSITGNAKGAAAEYLKAAYKDRFLCAQRWHISSYLFLLHYLQDVNVNELYGEFVDFERLFKDNPKLPTKFYNHKKIRIGYLLPIAKKSSLSNFVIPLFTKFDQDKFEVYIYSFEDSGDDFSREIKKSATSFKIINNIYTFDSAQTIRDDEIDILVDLIAYGLGGYTLSILACRPAKIQMTGIGFPGVTNLSFVDYVFADDILTDDFMLDVPLKLPNALVFRPDKAMLTVKKDKKNNNDAIVLGVFNNFLKITDEMLLLWKEILNSSPKVILHLQDSAIYEERSSFMTWRLEKLNMAERVTVKIGSENYLQDMANVDIILDTFPYTGGFMTATAVTLGVPIITLAGERFSSRFSASILNAANLNEYIAYSKTEYKTKVLETINKIKNNSLENIKTLTANCKLFDEKNYMKNLEENFIVVNGNQI